MAASASIALAALLGGCGQNGGPATRSFEATNGYDIRTMKVLHPSAYIVQMCYTKTTDAKGMAHNPCYACHNRNTPPNYVMEDEALQAAYDFPATALHNPYTNHFKDFSDAVAKIGDEAIIDYVDQSNYFAPDGTLALADRLKHLPKAWDFDSDGQWSGYIPDCYYHFDEHGLDHAPDGHYTRWAAFAYMPFLGTFWPTNGSTDDVLIRLPESFGKRDSQSSFDPLTYRTNLAIVQSLIQRKDAPIEATDERIFGIDLDKDGTLDTATQITYDWAPKEGRQMHYVGEAEALRKAGKIHLAAGLYPEGTEFLHSVRYIRSDQPGQIALAPRMKELRYAKKVQWLTYADLHNKGLADLQEQDINPDRLETFRGNMEIGLGNNMGWIYQGFIEDKYGELRPQSYEETLNCMGCHSGIATITDSTFAFPRKLGGWHGGWYHWSQKDLKGTPENRYSDGTWELENYLKHNHSGDEFRENDEVLSKFFLPSGDMNHTAIDLLHDDVTELLYPSHERAVKLNKAYRVLVQTQRFIEGKAAHIKPLRHVYKEVKEGEKTGNKIYLIP